MSIIEKCRIVGENIVCLEEINYEAEVEKALGG